MARLAVIWSFLRFSKLKVKFWPIMSLLHRSASRWLQASTGVAAWQMARLAVILVIYSLQQAQSEILAHHVFTSQVSQSMADL